MVNRAHDPVFPFRETTDPYPSSAFSEPSCIVNLSLGHSAFSMPECRKSSCSIGSPDARASLSPGKSGEVAQGLGACRTSSPMTLTENARRRLCPPTPAEACKVNMLKHTMSPGDNVHPRMGKSSRWLSISGSSPSVPSENHLAWLSMKDRGINQGPLCEPAMNSRVDSLGTGSTGIQKLTVSEPVML